MADIGEVKARITADVSSFTTGMQSAQASVASLQGSLAPATTTTKSFYEGMEQAGIFATGSERGIRRMEMALGAMAATTTGATGVLGSLTEGLLLFSGGSALALGALGIIAEIAGIYKLATAGAAEFTKENDKLAKAFEATVPAAARHRIAIDEIKQHLADLAADQTRVKSGFELMFDPNVTRDIYDAAQAATLMNTLLAEQAQEMDLSTRTAAQKLADANAKIFLPILEAQDRLKAFQQGGQLTDAQIRQEATVRAEAAGKSPAEASRAADAAVQLAHLERQLVVQQQIAGIEDLRGTSEARIGDAFETQMAHLRIQTAEIEAQTRAVQSGKKPGEQFWSDADIERVARLKLNLEGVTGALQDQEVAAILAKDHLEANLSGIEDAARQTAKAATEETRKSLREMQTIGRDAVRQLVEGFTQGTLDFGKILEGIIAKFVEDHVTTALFAALGIASPSKVGIEAGQYVAQGLAMGITGTPAMQSLGDLKLRMDLNATGMPAARSPFDTARDAAWLHLFKETSLVAQQTGFPG